MPIVNGIENLLPFLLIILTKYQVKILNFLKKQYSTAYSWMRFTTVSTCMEETGWMSGKVLIRIRPREHIHVVVQLF